MTLLHLLHQLFLARPSLNILISQVLSLFVLEGYSMLEKVYGVSWEFECPLIKSWSWLFTAAVFCCQGALHFTPTTIFSFLGKAFCFFFSVVVLLYLPWKSSLKRGSQERTILIFPVGFSLTFFPFFPLHSHLSFLSLYNTSRKKYGSGIDFCSWTSLNSCMN